ncbi:MAG TPA: hypothetical protein VII99_08610 [Bacteroidia bacterium]
MSYSKEDLSGKPPVPNGWYTLQFIQFRPRINQNKDGFNFNGEFSVVGNQEYEGRKVFNNMSNKAGFILDSIVHGMGLKMDVVQDGNEGTEAESRAVPGTFEHIDEFPEEPEKWGKYIGPLTNKTLDVELATEDYQGKQRNAFRQVRCNVAGCQEKHPTNMLRNKEVATA